MKIEEEIKQKRFRNEYQKAAINLIFTAGWLLNRQKDFFREFDITLTQYNVLRILKGQHPKSISTSEIRNRMMDKNSDASRIVDRLAARKLLRKQICPSDKRLVDVMIGEAGIRLLAEIDKKISELDTIISGLSYDEAKNLNNLLDKIRG